MSKVRVLRLLFSFLVNNNRYSLVSNRRGERNKWGGWQISAKVINGEGAINGDVWPKSPKLINGEATKNTAIINFIEIKSSNDLVKISTKRT